MKYAFISLIFITQLTNAQDTKQASDVFLESNPQLAKVMEIDEVKVVYENCFNSQNEGNSGVIESSPLMDCVWKDIEKNTDLKKKVVTLINTKIEDKNKATKDDGQKIISARSIDKYQKGKKDKKSKAMQALENYLKGKLEEALYGKIDPNKNGLVKSERIVDQETFNHLFESQVGKNIISSLSSYCMETVATSGSYFLIKNDKQARDETKSENMKNLAQTSEDGSTLLAAAHWNKCISTLQDHCYMTDKSLEQTEDGKIVQKANAPNYSSDKLNEICKEDKNFKSEECDKIVNYTQTRACEVTEYINSARLSLEANEKITQGYKKLKKGNSRNLAHSVYSGTSKDESSIDELTTLTSNEFASGNSDTNVLLASDQEHKKFESECFNGDEIIDAEKCKDYVDTNRNDKLEELVEMKLNSEASIAELQKLKEDGKDEEFIKILREDGYNESNDYTEEDLKELASQESVKDQILARYKAKQEALQRSIANDMKEITSSKDGVIDAEKDKDMIKKIGESIKNKTEDFAKLVHYNNIVSGYLEISGKDEKGEETKKKNSALLAREMSGNLFTDDNMKNVNSAIGRDLAGTGIAYDTIGEKFKSTGIEDISDGEKESVSLRPRQIVDSILGLFKKEKK